jgi:hypothetical protein
MIDLRELLRRNDALDRLATASTFRRIAVPTDCGRPLAVLPAQRPFPAPLVVYASGDGGLWFAVEGRGAVAYANPERVEDARIYDFRTYR